MTDNKKQAPRSISTWSGIGLAAMIAAIYSGLHGLIFSSIVAITVLGFSTLKIVSISRNKSWVIHI